MWFSLHSDCHKPAAALSNSLKCFPDLTLLQFPHSPGAGPVLLTLLLFFPLYFHPTEYCLDLYIPFQGSGTPACSQLLFWKIFCIWRCIPETFVEVYSMSTTPLPSCLPFSLRLFLDGYRWKGKESYFILCILLCLLDSTYMHCIITKNKGKIKINQSIKMQQCFFRGLLTTDKQMNKNYSTAIFLTVKV